MTRRRILLLCTCLSIAAIGLGFYAPTYFSPTAELMQELRSCLQPIDGDAPLPDAAADAQQEIQLNVVVMAFDVAKAGSLLSDAQNDNRAVHGVVNDNEKFSSLIKRLHRDGCVDVLTQPRLLALQQQDAVISTGDWIMVVNENGDVDPRLIGNAVQVCPSVRTDGRICVRLGAEISERDHVTVIERQNLILRDGQTGYFGGVKHKVSRQEPLLHVLGLNSWFIREVEREQEMLILVTPRVITPIKK